VSEQQTMEVEFALDPEDMAAFLAFQSKGGLGRWLFPLFFAMLLGMFAVNRFGDAHLSLSGGGGLTIFGGLALGAFVLLLLLRPLAVRFFITRSLAQYAKDPRNHWFFKMARVSITPEGLAVTRPDHTSRTAWTALWKVGVSDDHLFFFTSADAAIVVPRRAFRDEGHFAEFLALARRYHEQATAAHFDQSPPPTDHIHAPEERFDDRRSARH
jgi:hypothetical protein